MNKCLLVTVMAAGLILFVNFMNMSKSLVPPKRMPPSQHGEVSDSRQSLTKAPPHFSSRENNEQVEVISEHKEHAPQPAVREQISDAKPVFHLQAPTPNIPAPKSGSQLDGSLESALAMACPAGPGSVVLLTFGNMGVKDHLLNFVAHMNRNRGAFIIGAVDVAMFELLKSKGVPAYKTPLAFEEYKMDGSNQHSSGSWKRFAKMRTGEVNKVVQKGFHVLHTDSDVVWLRDPAPYLSCDEATRAATANTDQACEPLLAADILISTDNMSPRQEARGGVGYSRNGIYNSGMLFVRANAKGKHFAQTWHDLVVNPPPGSRYASLTSDQQVLNAMMRKPNQWPGLEAAEGARSMPAWENQLTMGGLPLALFQNGHVYFVQSADKSMGIQPYAVHATYSLDLHDSNAKRQRFRDSGLWLVEEDEYFTGRYLGFNVTLPPEVVAGGANIHTHMAAMRVYLEALRDALALATALNRTLVLPHMACYCDRMWAGSDDIFNSGCAYPGSSDGNFLPFKCPMDHVLPVFKWLENKVAYREAGFLDSARFRALASAPPVLVKVMPRIEQEAAPAELVSLPLGRTLPSL